jgi:thymidine kinase
MFLEPHHRGQRSGWIEVVCGSMFSGKTEELLRRIKRARIADMSVEIYKPLTDSRYSKDNVVSHDDNYVASIAVGSSAEILEKVTDAEVVAVDEAQFFDDGLTAVCEQLAQSGVRVIVAGLDMDFKGRPFGPMPQLLAVAEYITKLHAICPHCGNLATHSYRLEANDEQVMLGEKDAYEPRCRTCYSMGHMMRFPS